MAKNISKVFYTPSEMKRCKRCDCSIENYKMTDTRLNITKSYIREAFGEGKDLCEFCYEEELSGRRQLKEWCFICGCRIFNNEQYYKTYGNCCRECNERAVRKSIKSLRYGQNNYA